MFSDSKRARRCLELVGLAFVIVTATAAAASGRQQVSVTVTSPAQNAIVAGTVVIEASAVDNSGPKRTRGITAVDYSVDGNPLGRVTQGPPWSQTWDTTRVSNGDHSIVATAWDSDGNSASSSVGVVVRNTVADATPPSVTVTAPVAGATVVGTTMLSASASDAVGVTQV